MAMGMLDQIDARISDALSWSDVDGDSIPDELDAYPNDATQSFDSDGDGFGDNPMGPMPTNSLMTQHNGMILMAMATAIT